MDRIIFFLWRNFWVLRSIRLNVHLRMEKFVKDSYMAGPVADAFRSDTWRKLTKREKRFLIKQGYEEMVRQ